MVSLRRIELGQRLDCGDDSPVAVHLLVVEVSDERPIQRLVPSVGVEDRTVILCSDIGSLPVKCSGVVVGEMDAK